MTTTHGVRTLAAVALIGVLGGCGTRDAVDAAVEAREPGAQTPEATPAPESAAPSGPPWPAYGVEDYTFTLRVRCFCPDAGVPITVTVIDGKVVDAVIARKGLGRPAGAPAAEWARITINDVIESANDTDAHTIDVRWPAGQDYPTSVRVDRDANTIDEEIEYIIRDVSPARS